MSLKRYFVLSVIFVDLYSIVFWVYVFNTYDTHQQRVSEYLEGMVFFSTALQHDLIIILLNIISIVFLARGSVLLNETIEKILAILQIMVIMLFGWSLL